MEKNTKISLICSIVAVVLAIAAVVCPIICHPKAHKCESQEAKAESGAIVYFNLDKVVAGYNMANDLQASFNTKAQGIDQEVTRRRTKLENEDKELTDKLNKGLLTRSTAEVKYQDLQKKVADFQNYAQQKQQELAEEQQVILNNIADAINTFLKTYNEEKGYAMIISTQGDLLPSPVAIGDENLDITEELIEGLNAAYKK
ncbi:MAG: OmpH family outer membrane protein [Bacteroidales bacterium]|nr:OmpH family outer membrane protein [Bacteroidales bacterium]